MATGPIACIVWVCAGLALKDAREVIESGFGAQLPRRLSMAMSTGKAPVVVGLGLPQVSPIAGRGFDRGLVRQRNMRH